MLSFLFSGGHFYINFVYLDYMISFQKKPKLNELNWKLEQKRKTNSQSGSIDTNRCVGKDVSQSRTVAPQMHKWHWHTFSILFNFSLFPFTFFAQPLMSRRLIALPILKICSFFFSFCPLDVVAEACQLMTVSVCVCVENKRKANVWISIT